MNGPIRSALDFTSCIGENEEASPWEPLHVEHGFDPGDSTVAVLAAEAPQIVADTRSRSAVDLLATIADGWSKARARQFLWERLRKPARELRPGRDSGEGLSAEALAVFPEGAHRNALVPKFQAPESLRLLVPGGPAGRFTAIVPGSPLRNTPSRLVFRKIART